MTEAEKRSIDSIMNEVNKLTPADQTTKDMLVVFASGMAAGDSIGYSRALREVVNGTGADK